MEAELLAALIEAREDVESWASYADDYFQQKHHLADDLARIDAVIEKANQAGITGADAEID